MDKIIPAFELSLFDSTLSDACVDMAELGIDSIIDGNIFKSIPVVSVLIGIGKTAQNIHDRNLLKQTIKFINTFNAKKIAPAKLEKHRKKMKENPKFEEEELGRVIILLNSNVDLIKSELLAKFYRAYINEDITWIKFCELSEVINRLFVADLDLLYEIYQKIITDTSKCTILYQVDRLIGLGLLDSATKSIVIGNNTNSRTERYINVNDFGHIFCSITKNE